MKEQDSVSRPQVISFLRRGSFWKWDNDAWCVPLEMTSFDEAGSVSTICSQSFNGERIHSTWLTHSQRRGNNIDPIYSTGSVLYYKSVQVLLSQLTRKLKWDFTLKTHWKLNPEWSLSWMVEMVLLNLNVITHFMLLLLSSVLVELLTSAGYIGIQTYYISVHLYREESHGVFLAVRTSGWHPGSAWWPGLKIKLSNYAF